MTFNRGIADTFVNLLQAEAAKPSWWREVLDDKTLLVGVRDGYLNVYWQGQALFTVRHVAEKLRVTTHEKFLLDPDLKDQVGLEDGRFEIDGLRARGFMSRFEVGTTLPKMKRAAQQFAGNEKKGCHTIAERNLMVVDFEITLPVGVDSVGGADRIDLASFEEHDKGVRLTFWEAKHFTNTGLKAQAGDAKVVHQVEKYAAWIAAHRAELQDSYKRVAQNLTAFEAMGWKRALHPSIRAVAGGVPLTLDDVPPVGLLFFGFDQDQKLGPNWVKHRQKLEAQIGRIVALGNATEIRLPSRAQDSPVDSPVSEAEPLEWQE